MGISGQMLEMLFISNDDRGKGTGESLSIVIYEKSILSLARKMRDFPAAGSPSFAIGESCCERSHAKRGIIF